MHHSHTPTSAGRYRLLFLLLLFVAASGCRVSWTPAYEAEIDRQVATAAKLTNRLYLDMLEVPGADRTYARFSPRYTEIEAEINSLRMQHEARKKGGDILRMIDILDTQFREYKAAHREKGILPRGEAETCNDYMQSYWKTLMRTERNLNRKS